MGERRVIVIVGEAGVGKSALVAALAGQPYDDDRRRTIAADIGHLGDDVVYDVSGSPHMHKIAATLARNATHAIIAYSAAVPATLNAALDIWLPLLRDVNPRARLLLVALCVDLLRADTGADVRARIARASVPCLDASARIGAVRAVREWIYAEVDGSSDDTAPLLADAAGASEAPAPSSRCCCVCC